MNERIKELANQLGPIATIGNWGRVEWADNVYPQLGDRLYAAIDLEEFAELIVRECSGILRTEADSNWEGREERLLNAMADWIEQHFGVEE